MPFKSIEFVIIYSAIAVISWFISMQIATVVFGLLALRSVYFCFKERRLKKEFK